MLFKNVTDITIPQGKVKKIQETVGGRVLWEKKEQADKTFPRMTVFDKYSQLSNTYQSGYYFRACEVGAGGYSERYSIPLGGIVDTLRILKKTVPKMGSWSDNRVYSAIGDIFSAKCVNSMDEFDNFPYGAHEVSDAIWILGFIPINNSTWSNLTSYLSRTSPIIKLTPFKENATFGSVYTCKTENKSTLVSFTTYEGSSTRISSISSDYSDYLYEFENNKGSEYPKEMFPIVEVDIYLTVISPSLRIGFNEFVFSSLINR